MQFLFGQNIETLRFPVVCTDVIFAQRKWHWALLRSVMAMNGIHNVSFGHQQIQSAVRKSRFSQSW
jgi:hypothetical protein